MQEEQNAFLNRVNLIPRMVMLLLWSGPMLLFWGAAFGVLKPASALSIDTSPSLPGFLFWFAVCFLPYLLPGSYYQPRDFELNGHVYGRLGVRFFRRFVPNGDLINRWMRRSAPTHRIIRNRKSLREYREETRYNETTHLVWLLLGLFTAIYALRIDWYLWSIYLTSTNIVVNLYPIFLQRYTRSRIYKFSERFNDTRVLPSTNSVSDEVMFL